MGYRAAARWTARLVGLAGALLLAAVPTSGSDEATTAGARLLAAYPDHLAGVDGNWLVWKDGTRMPLDDGRGQKEPQALLEAPDLADMLHWPYPAGSAAEPPLFPVDPGRVRNRAFFDKMYGDCSKGEVEPHLVSVAWLPSKTRQHLKVTRVNGVAERLAAVSRELDQLPRSYDPFLHPAAGGYNCRPIAGTSRPSVHGAGIAIDIAVSRAHYWQWSKPDPVGRYVYKNVIPPEIVAIFEKHGFIWGGRWYHYDTMHFEYRPELLPARQ